MKTFNFRSEPWLPQPKETIFVFFADARNLQAITPRWLSFEVLTPPPIVMQAGTLIDYRLRVHGFPIRWRTEITGWNPPQHFVDTQLRGPYTLWHHTHTFSDHQGGTNCFDEVRYRPRGGRLLNYFFVRRDIEKIFAYRRECLLQHFPAT
jgi:ligand-binding SRPBCC domain-containing protein